MNEKTVPLLPTGFYDLLPPDARKESLAVEKLVSLFGSFGYAQVSPPLMEFESSMLSGRGEALSAKTFRVSDPASSSMMGVRADITLQVARIAKHRLATSPRPLRLCYAGQIVQRKPEALQNERQLTQTGIELIGSNALEADAEVMMLAIHALHMLGIDGVSIDINLPGLIGRLCGDALGDAGLKPRIANAVSQRDTVSIRQLPLQNAAIIADIIESSGEVNNALAALEKHKLEEAPPLRTLINRLRDNCPYAGITLDPLEFTGFDYHQGISFTLFARGLRYELGRGGRYEAEGDTATGFTLYVTHLLSLLPALAVPPTILIPHDASLSVAESLIKEGWVVTKATQTDCKAEAKKLGIAHLWEKGKAVTV